MKIKPSRFLLLFVLANICCTGPQETTSEINSAFNYSIRKKITSPNGAVVSAHPLASSIGVKIMKEGGNAFDAAIATQLALAVVYPGAGNIGGGGFLVARTEKGELISLDFRESAPANAHKDMYLDSNRNVIPNKSIRGEGAAGVPGSVAGFFETMKYARLPFRSLIAPAIQLADNGFVITESEASSLNHLQEEFTTYNDSLTPFHRNVPWKAGDTLIQKELAQTLSKIRDSGLNGFYKGSTASAIVGQMQNGGGYITASDLENYKAKWRKPHQFLYKGIDVVTMALPSSGGILLHQMLKMVEDRNIKALGHLSAGSVQLVTEIERRAYADRAEYLGDADFFRVPVKELIDPAYIRKRMVDYIPGKAGSSSTIKPGTIVRWESEETTHLNVIDSAGNVVAVTTTLNDSYGSKTFVQGAGFLLNNEMDDFSIKPGEPNLYGAVGGEANAIAPGKRMLSSMSPTILLKNGKPFLVLGTPGGTTIPTSVFQTILNIVDFELSTTASVNSPKFHHQWLPDEVFVETNFPDSTVAHLEKMGYKISVRGTIGRTEVIKVLPDGSFEAVADIRGDDHAEGF